MRITILDDSLEEDYTRFLLGCDDSLFYASNGYRLFLKEFLGAEDRYLIAMEEGRIAGVLPLFIKRNSMHGAVINSLPFYGSNGGVIAREGVLHAKRELIKEFIALSEREDCISSTIVASPFESDGDLYEKEAFFGVRDVRIGQFTPLPEAGDSIGERLMNIFAGIKRTDIRKAIKNGVTTEVDNGGEAMGFVAQTHKRNIEALGGLAKPERFFDLIPKYFRPGADYKIYVARLDGKPIGAMLLFYYNKTVEYFTPASVEEFRPLQALSLLAFEAMKDAVSGGFKWWNWGGTWTSQDGVYMFKSRFGSKDFAYKYYIGARKERDYFRRLGKEILLREYPYFYVYPFAELGK
ncbi:MAG: peptidoglycan bridge formation glycyltransferase FemA/FemB family protein [Nitrospinota bacterium]|nr:peptidoglycan bridge formation glycyltransferase FemA/FemB family protein [Nitrospinota bacterium]